MNLLLQHVRFASRKKATWLVFACALVSSGVGAHYAQQRALAAAKKPSATVSFEYTSWTVNATSGTAEIGVTMTGTPTGPVSVAYSTTTGGTAKPGRDFLPVNDTFEWSPNQAGTTKTFTIRVFNRTQPGGTRTVNLALSDPTDATLGVSTAVLYITDANMRQCTR